MKKLFVIFGALAFTAGVAIGQSNQATVGQDGDLNDVSSSQTGLNQINQIDQYGSMNQTIIGQSNEGNVANINQSSDNGFTTADGYVNQLNVSQTGKYGDVIVDQIFTGSSGDGANTATINQSLNSRTGDNRRPLNQIFQEGYNNAAVQSLEYQGYQSISQIGADNQATQIATGDGDYRHNGQRVIQGASGDEAYGYTALQDQLKRFNNARIEQYGQGYGSTATQIQGGETSKAFIYQRGEGSTAYQTQVSSLGVHNNLGSSKDEADIRQYSDNVDARQYQDSDPTANNKAFIVQNENSDLSSALQEQTGNSNWSSISQTGTGNNATSIQFNYIDPPVTDFGNLSTIIQNGNNNTANVTQTTP